MQKYTFVVSQFLYSLMAAILRKQQLSVAPLTCGVPQGCILGPLLFSLDLYQLDSVLQRHGVSIIFMLLAPKSKWSLNKIINIL